MLVLATFLLASEQDQCAEQPHAVASLADLYQTLQSSSVAWVPANKTIELLSLYEQSVADAARQSRFAEIWDAAIPQRDEQGREVYEFKDTLVSYYALDTSQEHFDGPRRSTDKVYVNRTSDESSTTTTDASSTRKRSDGPSGGSVPSYVIEHIDPTTQHDVSFFRVHKAWPENADAHPLTRAMLGLLFTTLRRVVAADGAMYEAMMSAMRVRRSETEARYKAGEPGPEGVHQDSAVLTAIVLVDRVNVAAHTGGNRVWSLEQPAGKPCAADLRNASRLHASVVLRDRFDMLFVMDREVKHEACAIEPADADRPAVRDVWTFEVRRIE